MMELKTITIQMAMDIGLMPMPKNAVERESIYRLYGVDRTRLTANFEESKIRDAVKRQFDEAAAARRGEGGDASNAHPVD